LETSKTTEHYVLMVVFNSDGFEPVGEVHDLCWFKCPFIDHRIKIPHVKLVLIYLN